MYRCFQLKLGSIPVFAQEAYSNYEEAVSQTIRKIRERVTNKIIKGDTIDATLLQNNWFPGVKADIFISHSHLDSDKAHNLSVWLYDTFGLVSFIDEDIWGYADDLLRQIDDDYCFVESRHVYDYRLRNLSTTHVHAMLSNALIQMIDQTECLFFLHSKNSIKTTDTAQNAIQKKTESPWLYLELMMSQIIRQRVPDRHPHMKMARIQNQKIPPFQYDVDLSQLPVIMDGGLEFWEIEHKKQFFQPHPLDTLYEITDKRR